MNKTIKITPQSGQTNKTPASLGYAMPAEWEPHEATWLAWPHNAETWAGKRLKKVEETFLQMMEGLLPHEKVKLLVPDEKIGEGVKKRLEKMGIGTRNLALFEIPTADAWIRDYGPTVLKKKGEGVRGKGKGEKAWVKWVFNAWGEKYKSLMKDNAVFLDSGWIESECFEAGIVLEGGSIEVNGAGTCLTTEQCLLNKNRNPKMSRKEIEKTLKDYLGVSHIVWLKEGIAGDDTDGHIDDIARFVDKRTILAVFESDPKDANYEILKENWQQLKHAEDQDGKRWNVVKLPMPGIVADGQTRLPASYANFLISNEAVLLPVFGHRNDREAVKILKDYFPKREILPIPCTDLVVGLGSIHCVSQQEPA